MEPFKDFNWMCPCLNLTDELLWNLWLSTTMMLQKYICSLRWTYGWWVEHPQNIYSTSPRKPRRRTAVQLWRRRRRCRCRRRALTWNDRGGTNFCRNLVFWCSQLFSDAARGGTSRGSGPKSPGLQVKHTQKEIEAQIEPKFWRSRQGLSLIKRLRPSLFYSGNPATPQLFQKLGLIFKVHFLFIKA